ncbi:phosphoribosylglycinamide formyltransferase [Jeotgalibacillus haloalkalitolerans]|uniref:Phosphoribosylglycinamide formyltransferase n=1 Tax=Jeotgalibacillus haloalkalitolerans TaxID=3104292 RepID=A0ABU5KRC1_9BACL|nr:phosphoribosylglycinamide formyltransferase [Jeotgalibacillus sp. HH7-29]MDZ5713501.1 phosphoribosylglycinamide formyltransferase [Jeotgalibacillus sp. HH7-29]
MSEVKFAVFASGSGSNFEAIAQAIRDGRLKGSLVLLVTDKPGAFAVNRAEALGVDVCALNPKDFPSKAEYETAILEMLHEKEVEWLVLAGYMRLIGSVLLQAYPKRIVNVHPSLLPAFPGKDALGQAIDSGMKVTGVTIHYVDEGMDTGPVIVQEPFKIPDGWERDEIEKVIHGIEHRLYPETLNQLFAEALEETK